MSEENNEEIIAEQTPNRKPLYIALAVVGVLIIGASAFWFYRSRDTGRVVQAPRNITFGDNSTGRIDDGAFDRRRRNLSRSGHVDGAAQQADAEP